jgi:hypothetical protein
MISCLVDLQDTPILRQLRPFAQSRIKYLMRMSLPTPEQSSEALPAIHSAWSYLRPEMLTLSWALMEIALLTPLLLSFLRWMRYWPSGLVVVWLLLLLLLPFNLIRFMTMLGLYQERQRLVMIGALFFVAFFSLRTLLHEAQSLFDLTWLGDFYRSLAEPGSQLWQQDIALFTVTCLVWWRGIRLSTRTPDIDRAGLRLRLSSFFIIPLLIWLATDFLSRSILPFILLFFTAGLTSVALIRAEQSEYERTGLAASLTPRWLGSIFLAAVAVVLTAAVLALIISGQSPETIGAWTAPIWLAIRFGTTTAMITALFIASPLLNLLTRIMETIIATLSVALSGIWNALQALTPDLVPPLTPEDMELATEAADNAGVSDGTKIIWILLMLAAIFLVTLALSRLYRQATIAAINREELGRQAIEPGEKPNLLQRALQKLGLLRGLSAALSIPGRRGRRLSPAGYGDAL